MQVSVMESCQGSERVEKFVLPSMGTVIPQHAVTGDHNAFSELRLGRLAFVAVINSCISGTCVKPRRVRLLCTPRLIPIWWIRLST
jgi:hypothetical protein